MYKVVKSVSEEKWKEFLLQNVNSNIFQSQFMAKVHNLNKKVKSDNFFCVDQNGNIFGIVVAVKQNLIGVCGFGINRIVVFGGPIVKENNNQITSILLNALKKKYKYTALYIEIRNMFYTDKELFRLSGFNYEPHLEIIVDLTKSEEVLWAEAHSKRRNTIRRSIKEGCEFSLEDSVESLQDCYNILKEVYGRAKLPLHDYNYFKELFKNSTDNLGIKMFCAKHNSKIIGCMVALVFKDTIYDYYAGAYSDYYDKYPNDLIPWEVFKWGKENGYTKFLFGGAGKPNVPYGVRDYKKRFGGKMVEYGRYYYYSSKILYELAEKSFKLLQKLRGEK